MGREQCGSGLSGAGTAIISRGLELFVIDLLTNFPPGDVTRQAETPTLANRLI